MKGLIWVVYTLSTSIKIREVIHRTLKLKKLLKARDMESRYYENVDRIILRRGHSYW
jgi:hypothetical protein